MRLAVSVWNGRVAPVFDVSRQLQIFEIEGGEIAGRSEAALPGTFPQAQAARVVEIAPDVLVCGAISQQMAAFLAPGLVNVIPFTAGTVEEVVAGWMNNSLPGTNFAMPGCCGRRRGRRFGMGRGRRGRKC